MFSYMGTEYEGVNVQEEDPFNQDCNEPCQALANNFGRVLWPDTPVCN